MSSEHEKRKRVEWLDNDREQKQIEYKRKEKCWLLTIHPEKNKNNKTEWRRENLDVYF